MLKMQKYCKNFINKVCKMSYMTYICGECLKKAEPGLYVRFLLFFTE